MQWLGVDVSGHQGTIDWAKVKSANPNIRFAIIKATEGVSYTAPTFEANYQGCKANGIYVGAYHYLQATNAIQAVQEAKHFAEVIAGKQFEMPIYLDIEEEKHTTLSKAVCTQIVNSFCGHLESLGYYVGVYSFQAFLQANLDKSVQNRYTIWVANITNRPLGILPHDMWQYSWKGRVAGINADVDMNKCFKNFPQVIQSAKKNGYGSTIQKPSAPSAAVILSNAAFENGYITNQKKWENFLSGKSTPAANDLIELFQKLS